MGKDSESATGTTVDALLRDPTSPQAWERFVERYGPRVRRWCLQWGLQEADANDVGQEVLIKLALNMRKCTYDRAKGKFRTWLNTMAHNAWRDLRDDQKRQVGWVSGDSQIQRLLESQEAADNLAQAVDAEYERELLEQAMPRVQLRVDPRTWEAFRLRTSERWSGARVAEHLKMGVNAVYMAQSRVNTMLKEEIRKLGGCAEGED